MIMAVTSSKIIGSDAGVKLSYPFTLDTEVFKVGPI
jgi:hypothetical protein